MSKIKKIVLGYDFSKPSVAALQSAVYKAHLFQAELHVVHVLPTEVSVPYVPKVADEMLKEIQENLNHEVEGFVKKSKHKPKAAFIEVVQGQIHESLLKRAAELKADLVMVGSHGRSKLGAILLGSSAGKMVRLSPMPVYVDRSNLRSKVKTILLPVDDPKNAEEMIKITQTFAEAYKAKIQLFHVVDNSEYYFAEYLSLAEKAKLEAITDLEELKKKYKLTKKPIVEMGSPADLICEEAEKNTEIGLIAMSTHGVTGWNRLLLGSVAESVVRHAPCSILTVRSKAVEKEVGRIFKKKIMLR